MQYSFRSLTPWPHATTAEYARRVRPFKVGWTATMTLLDREIENLDGSAVLFGVGLRDQDIRLDGRPRAGAPNPSHPGVEISFDSRHGRLAYATDVCSRWEDNVRSIALGLEALRAVDRYGVASRGQQYTGWRELPSGAGRGVIIANTDEAWAILLAAADEGADDLDLEGTWREAAKRTHPDGGGDGTKFIRVKAAYELLKATA